MTTCLASVVIPCRDYGHLNFRPYLPLIPDKLSFLFEQNRAYHRARGQIKLAVVAAADALRYQPFQIQPTKISWPLL